jgi:hypothetical protein
MALKNDWLSDVLTEVREEVGKWPDWKRSDEVRRELRKLEERKSDPSEVPTHSAGAGMKDFK